MEEEREGRREGEVRGRGICVYLNTLSRNVVVVIFNFTVTKLLFL